MTNERVYGRKLTMDEAFAELEDCSGTQFDPHVVDVLVATGAGRPQRRVIRGRRRSTSLGW